MSLQHHKPTETLNPSNPSPKDPATDFAVARQVSDAVANRLQALSEPAEEELPARRRRVPWGLLTIALLAILAVGGGVFYYVHFVRGGNEFADLEFQAVTRGKLILSVVDKGELEAAENKDIHCKVRSSGRGQSIASSIKWLIDEGTPVKAGDVVCRLDKSGLEEQAKNQKLVIEEKKSLKVQAETDKVITKIQNETEVKTAENSLTIAIIDLQKYVGEELAKEIATWDEKTLDQFRLEGLALVERKRIEIKGELEKLAEDVKSRFIQAEEKVKWSDRMLLLDYVSTAQNRTDRINRDNLGREQNQLLKHEARKMILDLVGKVKQAQANVEVAKKKLEGNMAQAQAKYGAAVSVLAGEETKLNDLLEDIENCTITAPNEGMVVYHVDERNRFGGSQTNMIAINESVREGQKLMRIPDLRQMQVKVKIHEGLAARMRQGQPARIKIASVEQTLSGDVKDVSSVASSTDWMSSDVKVYPTTVLINSESIPAGTELKPQMSAEVTILLDEKDNVLRLPVQAILETANRKFCYVKTANGLEKRFLVTGLNNTKFVEIKEGDTAPNGLALKDGEKFGLKEGEIVVMNPRGLAEKLGDLHTEAKDPGEGLQLDPKKLGKKFVDEKKSAGDEKRPRGGPDSKRGPGGGAGGPGGPGAGGPGGGGPGGPGGGGGSGRGGFGQMSEEDRARYQKEMDDFKAAMKNAKTPEERKKLWDKRMKDTEKAMKDRGVTDEQLQQFFPFIKQRLKDELAKDGVEVPE